MKKYISHVDIPALLVAIYACLVWMTFLYLNITTTKIIVVSFSVMLGLISYFLIWILMTKIRRIHFTLKKNVTNKIKIEIFICSTFVAFLVMSIWFLAYYPGSFSVDSIIQYGQAISGVYNDWHPVWHTLVFFTLPLAIFRSPASIIIMQLIYFALILGYLALTIYELSNLKSAVFSCAYILLNPYVGYIMLYPWKDVGFALAGLLSTVIAIRLIYYPYKTTRIWKLMLFSLVLASATIFRHNAILYTLPLLFALFFNINKKVWIKLFVLTICVFWLIKVPIYNFLGATNPGDRVVESTGLPLTIIGNVAKETPQLMDEELSEFVYSIATQEQWEEYYKCGNFNSIKWEDINTCVVEEQGYVGMLRLMIKCFKLSPNAAIDAFVALTDIVYGFENGLEGNVGASIADNSYNIFGGENEKCQLLVTSYASFINSSIFRYFRTYGICLFAILIVILSKLKFTSWFSWKKAIIAVPIFSYDFGTMFFLSGPDSRLFFITFLVTPLLIVYALCNGEKKISE